MLANRWGQTYTFYKNHKTNMTINSIRNFLYWISKTLGNINAVSKGKVGKRVARRTTGKATGKVLKVFPAKQRAIVEGVRFIKRHTKPTQTNQQGGIIEKEAPINMTNLMVYCDKCSRGVKIGSKLLDDGSRVRVCKKCGEMISNT